MPQLFRTPSLFLGAARILAWFFWRDVPVTKPQARHPRRPILQYVQTEVPEDVLAVLRFSYFKQGVARKVEEYRLMEDEDCTELLRYVVDHALEQGADVSLLAAYDPEEIGLKYLKAG